jgi:tetratricopeptide (TPR) repeat protein
MTPPRQAAGLAGSDTPCPAAEALAVYIDGRANPSEAAAIESHVASCDDCFSLFADVNRQRNSNRKLLSFRSHGWRMQPIVITGLAAVAAILVAVVFLPRTDRVAELDLAIRTLQARSGPFRSFEPRLAEDTTYREVASLTRSAGETGDPRRTGSDAADDTAMRSAALKIQKAADDAGESAASSRALGFMYLTLGDAGRAVAALEPFAASLDGGGLNDLAAAYLARRRDGDTQKALGLLEQLVSREPHRAEAWFNLAVAAEAEGQPARAIEACGEVLKVDRTSGWASEARSRLQKLTTR